MGSIFKLSIIGMLVATILACAQPAQQGGTGGGQTPAQEPKYGGMLHYAASGIAPNVHPFTAAASGTDIVVGPVYEPLLKTYLIGEATDATPENGMGPWLAESWTNPNPTTYIFKIRQGVKWQDGKDFTAEDVVFTWDYLLKNKGQFTKASDLSGVQSFRAIDTYTVELVSKAPNADFLQKVSARNSIVMIPKHLVEAGADLTKVSMGTGPFKVKDFNTARGVVHVKNEHYWMKDMPYLDGIIGFYNMDRSAMIAAMTVGQMDIFNPDNEPQFEVVQSGVPNLGYASYAQQQHNSLLPKLTQAPFNDLRVRQAMNLAIDRQTLNTTLSKGKGIIHPPGVVGWLTGFALPQEELLKRPGFNPATKQQDIAEAKRLLAEAGYPNGFNTSVVYNGQNSATPPIVEIVATQLKAIGINVTIKPLENNLYNDQARLKGNFEIDVSAGGNANFGSTLLVKFHSKGADNKTGLADPVLDELIEKQAVTLDQKERQKIMHDIQRRMLDNAYLMPTIDSEGYTTWQPWVHNYVYTRGPQIKPSYQPPVLWLDTSMLSEGRLKEDAAAIK